MTWDDFQDTLSLKGVPSAFNAFLRIEKTEKRDGNTRTIRPEAQACFDKRHSFADRQIQNENLLRLFQLKYDLLEMYRRRLQTELNLGVVGIAADNRTRQYMDLYTEKSKKAEQNSNVQKSKFNNYNDTNKTDYDALDEKLLDMMLDN